MSNKLEDTWRVAVVSIFVVPFQRSLGGTGQNHEMPLPGLSVPEFQATLPS